MLAPQGRYSYRDNPRIPREKKTLRIGGTYKNNEIKEEVDSECSDGTGEKSDEKVSSDAYFTKSLLTNLKASKACSI